VQDVPTVAVAGTHGKTTTSGMVATLSQAAGLDPTWLLVPTWRPGPEGALGLGHLAVVEADEGLRLLSLWLAPDIALVTNVEEDHLDHYGTLEA